MESRVRDTHRIGSVRLDMLAVDVLALHQSGIGHGIDMMRIDRERSVADGLLERNTRKQSILK